PACLSPVPDLSALLLFSLHPSASHRDLHSFPTRRSSDLVAAVLAAFVAFAWAGLRVALLCKDPFGKRLAVGVVALVSGQAERVLDRKSTRLNSSHLVISYAVFCLKKKKKTVDT